MVDLFFTNPEMRFVLNIILAFIIGFAIGIERESRGKDAGISTHTLVVMGSMLFTYLSMHVEAGSDSGARIAAQIVSGIGFLGAGLILKDGISVRNLTTAASLWFAAAIGMAIGFEYYTAAIVSSLAAIITLRIPHMSAQGQRDSK